MMTHEPGGTSKCKPGAETLVVCSASKGAGKQWRGTGAGGVVIRCDGGQSVQWLTKKGGRPRSRKRAGGKSRRVNPPTIDVK